MEITYLLPLAGTHFSVFDTPDFSVSYVSDKPLVSADVTVDGKLVPVNIGKRVIGEMPDLTVGKHTLCVTLSDGEQTATAETEFFRTEEGLTGYRGEIHSHTGLSDGADDPDEAYRFVRDEAKLDFFAPTDHNYFFTDEFIADHHGASAEKFNEDGKFVTFCGQEYTSRIEDGFVGHVNILNTTHAYSAVKLHLPDLYEAMSKDEACFGQFNHPGQSWGDHMDMAYSSIADEKMFLFEFQGGENALYEERWIYALSLGWHLSPTFNEDNHEHNWTMAYPHHTVMMASALTRADLLYAVRHNRTFATSDLTLKLDYRVNGRPMGSRLVNPDKLQFSVAVSTEREKGLGTFQLIGQEGITLAETDAAGAKEFTWEFTIDPTEKYYYIKSESQGIWLVSAPVWVEKERFDLSDLVKSRRRDKDVVSTTVSLIEPLTDVKAYFYLCPCDRCRRDSALVATVELGDKPVGSFGTEAEIVMKNPTYNRVVCRVEGKRPDGETVAATKSCRLSPLYITETAFVSSPDKGVEKPYNYIELYNNTNQPLQTGLWLVMMNSCGLFQGGYAKNHYPIEHITFAPYIPTVLWVKKKGNNLTVADFNAHYGTALEEGKNLFVIESELDSPVTGSPIEWAITTHGGYELVGAHWNYDSDRATQSEPDTAMQYAVSAGNSRYETILAANAAPTPGEVLPSQVPAVTD